MEWFVKHFAHVGMIALLVLPHIVVTQIATECDTWEVVEPEFTVTAEFLSRMRGCPGSPTLVISANATLRIESLAADAAESAKNEICIAGDQGLLAVATLDVTGVTRIYHGNGTDDLLVDVEPPDSVLLCRHGSLLVSSLHTPSSSNLQLIVDNRHKLQEARYAMGTAVLGSKALFAGGYYHGGGWSDEVDIFEESSEIWTESRLSVKRYGAAGAALRHIAIFFGGLQGKPSARVALNTVDIYNNATDTWSATAFTSPPRGLGAATGVGDLLIFAGGRDADRGNHDSIDMYNIVTGTWSASTLSSGRHGLAAVTVGSVALFAGGGTSHECAQSCNMDNVHSDQVDIFDALSSTWSTARLSEARSFLAAVAHGSRAFFGGGDITGIPYASKRVDIYDASTGLWSISEFPQSRSLMAAAAAGQTVIFFGGTSREGGRDNSEGRPMNEMFVLDVHGLAWQTKVSSSRRFLVAGASVGTRAVFAGGFEEAAYSDTKLVEVVRVMVNQSTLGPQTVHASISASWTDLGTGINGSNSGSVGGAVSGQYQLPATVGGSVSGQYQLPATLASLGVRIDLPARHGVHLEQVDQRWELPCGNSVQWWEIACNNTIDGKVQRSFAVGASDVVCIAIDGVCPVSKYSAVSSAPQTSSPRETGMTECTPCPPQTTTAGPGSSKASECVCERGYTGPSQGPCAVCAAGKYKDVIGSTECKPCPANTYSGKLGATSTAACLPCMHGAVSPNGSVSLLACECDLGYTLGPDNQSCVKCVAGTFKAAQGPGACRQCEAGKYAAVFRPAEAAGMTENPCKECPRNTFSSPDKSKCQPCPYHMVSALASSKLSDCTCARGYTGPEGGACVACSAGKFKGAIGTGSCVQCPAGKISTASAATAASMCRTCGADSYSSADNRQCLGCPSYSVSAQASWSVSACSCALGYTGDNGGPCRACEPGKYKDQTGSAACTLCPRGKILPSRAAVSLSSCSGYCRPNTYASANNSECLTCPFYSVSAMSSANVSDCKCEIGYTGEDGGPCVACAVGSYKATNGSEACTLCEFGKYSNRIAATSAESCNIDLLLIALVAAVVAVVAITLCMLLCSVWGALEVLWKHKSRKKQQIHFRHASYVGLGAGQCAEHEHESFEA